MRSVHMLVLHNLYYLLAHNHHLDHMILAYDVIHSRRDNHVMISRSPTQIRHRSRA